MLVSKLSAYFFLGRLGLAAWGSSSGCCPALKARGVAQATPHMGKAEGGMAQAMPHWGNDEHDLPAALRVRHHRHSHAQRAAAQGMHQPFAASAAFTCAGRALPRRAAAAAHDDAMGHLQRHRLQQCRHRRRRNCNECPRTKARDYSTDHCLGTGVMGVQGW